MDSWSACAKNVPRARNSGAGRWSSSASAPSRPALTAVAAPCRWAISKTWSSANPTPVPTRDAMRSTVSAAVWGVLTPRQPWAWLALLVAGLTVGLFITQGRGFAAKYQAVALVCGASAAVCAGVLKYALDTPKGVQTGLLWPAIFVAAFAALGLAVALVVPATRFRPIIRLTVEWLEVLAMIALLPAAAALGGLFAWLRH